MRGREIKKKEVEKEKKKPSENAFDCLATCIIYSRKNAQLYGKCHRHRNGN